ncbi:MAG: hypothetical protein Q7R30_25320 [Acidobacteriota bacterium]|nr:hypothetical protein [Acidobacteriota bacterium]
MAQNQLHAEYDPKADLLLARFGAPAEADTVVIEGDVAVRLSRETGQPIGIEVVDCAAKFRKDPSAITAAFARELLASYGHKARVILEERRRSVTVTKSESAHTQ